MVDTFYGGTTNENVAIEEICDLARIPQEANLGKPGYASAADCHTFLSSLLGQHGIEAGQQASPLEVSV